MSAPERLGRYRLLQRVGAGGMGEVHRARAYGAEGVVKELCIKRIRVERLAAPGALEAFVREARLSARMAHPNIVPVFDFGRCEDQYYLAMEWIDGVDLSTLLGAGGELADEVVGHLAAEVARALSYAHESAPDAPIVHRDVKPANVLVSRTGDVRLGDFGVAHGLGSPCGVAGTKAYMAPEAARGAAQPASDVYSLGRLIERARVAPPEGEPDPLGALVRELVGEDPDDRPTAAAAVARLEAFVAGFVAAGAPSPRETLAARVRETARGDEPASGERALPETESFLHAPEPTATTAAPPPAEPPRRRPAAGWVVAAVALLAGVGGVAWWAGARSIEAVATPPELAPAAAALTARVEAATPAPSRVEAEPPEAPIPPPAAPDAPIVEGPVLVAAPPAARPRRVPRRPADAPAPVSAQAPGLLSINAIPWAVVTIDGTPRGTTPLLAIPLTAAEPHTVELWNDVLGTRTARTVRIASGARDRLIVDLREP